MPSKGIGVVALAASSLAGCQAGDVASAAAAGAFGALALALVAFLAWTAGAARERSRREDMLREKSRHAQALKQLAGPLTWETDDQLRLRAAAGGDGGAPAWAQAAAHGMAGASLLAWIADMPSADSAQPGLEALLSARARVQPRPVRLLREPADAPALELAATPLHDPTGRFCGYLGVLRDRARTPSAGDAVSGDDALSFSYTLSHDLRAPVRVVEGFTRIVKEDYGDKLDRVGNDHLDRVLAAAARMNQMIDALLEMARLSSQPLQRQTVNLSQLAGYVIDELRRGAPERRIEFEIEPGLQVQGDPTLLRQLLENLLGNAWKYTQRAADARVRFVRQPLDGGSVYVVQDNGAGFDMRSVERLFGLFQRLHSASDFPGTGVGLASVKRIVARHGGRIWAESEPGRGATFRFTLKD